MAPFEKPMLDTVPEQFKKHFFKDKEMPNLLHDGYDLVGFDLDSTLVKF